MFFLFWTYFGYFIYLKVRNGFTNKPVRSNPISPQVSLIVTVYNEESHIREKIENCLSVHYPSQLREIIFVSDGSTDRTNEIITSYADNGITLLTMNERRGKDYSQGEGVKIAKGEIIIFTDATTFLEENALEEIVSAFADDDVGCVSGNDKTVGESGEGAYVKYEMALRELESSLGSVVVVSGCFFAIRKSLCQDWYPGLTSDFYLPIMTHIQGQRVVQQSSAIGSYNVTQDSAAEFKRKVRTVVNGFDVLATFWQILNPFVYGHFAFQMFSHKLCRWLVPYFLITLFLSNTFLVSLGSIYAVTLFGQIVMYLLALIGHLSPTGAKHSIVRIPLFFVMVNLSILAAWTRAFSGRSETMWEPTER